MKHPLLPSLDKLPWLLLLALALRLVWFQGFAFSDDAHYAWLAAHPGSQYGVEYFGYPVMPLRIGHITLLQLGRFLLGPGDWGLALFPMLLSLLTVGAGWRLGHLLGGSPVAGQRAAFLLALLPVDIVMASLAFADLSAAAVLGLGMWLLIEARHGAHKGLRIPGALLVGGSLLWKETVLWLVPLLLLGQAWLLWRDRHTRTRWSPDPTLLAALLGIAAVVAGEALVYTLIHGDPLWRFARMELNTQLCPDDFFKLGSAKGYARPEDYTGALLRLLFLEHPIALFLRRNTLYILALAGVQLLLRLKAGRPGIHGLWFGGLLLAFAFGSTSLARYQPLPLDLPWYILPLFLPGAVLAGELLARLPQRRFLLLAPLFLGLSLWMCRDFMQYFDRPGLQHLRQTLEAEPDTPVHGDTFSLYSLAHLDGADTRHPGRGHVITDGTLDAPAPGHLLLLHAGNLKEQRAQGRPVPDLPDSLNTRFTRITTGAGYVLYRSTR